VQSFFSELEFSKEELLLCLKLSDVRVHSSLLRCGVVVVGGDASAARAWRKSAVRQALIAGC